ncbi:MAG: helix-turn-helix transcriptional regulator [Candidatus Sulfotelmatobacter sp.]
MCAFYAAERKNHPSPIPSNARLVRFVKGNEVRHTDAKPGGLLPVVRDGRLRKILQVIESQPSLKIHELAIECNLSPSHLQHLFKQSTGFGLGEVLTEQRMQHAVEFLAQSNLSIKEIASTVGYEHTSSFSRAFERRFGQTPSSYRQAQDPDNAASQERLKFG